jgi:mRNA interferase RelE/StbE
MTLQVLETPTFGKIIKKLHANAKSVVDQAIKQIAADPTIGEDKKGDLAGIFVYKFKINKQEVLLSYRLQPDKFSPQVLVLLSLGRTKIFTPIGAAPRRWMCRAIGKCHVRPPP